MSGRAAPIGLGPDAATSNALVEVRDLRKHFADTGVLGRRRRVVRAVDGVSFALARGETLGLVGESGCGKSTLARALLFLDPPTSGDVFFDGARLAEADAKRLRRRAQIVFQDPYASLPPRMRVGKILADPLRMHGVDRGEVPKRVRELLADVGMPGELARKLPHELSGGQRQRIGIARALSVHPSLVVADEAVSSLDASVQAQILNLFVDLQQRRGLTYLFISHDLGVVKYMSHRIAVMYLGEIVELGPADDLYAEPLHPYTRALISATPTLDRRGERRIQLPGEPPSPSDPPSGCKFHPRCPLATQLCRDEHPPLREVVSRRWSACHYAEEVPARMGTTPRAETRR
jgi:oligopeptide/dipeptide ABC transporter ATP-binding protein